MPDLIEVPAAVCQQVALCVGPSGVVQSSKFGKFQAFCIAPERTMMIRGHRDLRLACSEPVGQFLLKLFKDFTAKAECSRY